MMIREIARLDIDPDRRVEFERAIQDAVPIFRRAKGCLDVAVNRSIEAPGRYWLVVEWQSVDDHLVGFRQSSDFQEWRRIVGGFFLSPPAVEHVVAIALE